MKIMFSGLGVTDGRGKINGTVASKNRAGAYARVKVSPVNPQSTYQLTERNRLKSLSQAWRALTAVQRAAWVRAVSNFMRSDVFGSMKALSGQQLFVSLNRNLVNAGQTQITSPPLPSAVEQPVAGTLVITNGGAKTVAYTGTTAASTLLIWATDGLSPGIGFVKNRYKQIQSAAGNIASPIDIAAAYQARFGDPAVGTKVYVKIEAVNNTTGQKSLASQTSTTVV